jgi:catechol 2,3-dioxygenase-like lactoylglutathione lyase family enzyme
MAMNLDHTIVHVKDVQKSIRFYCDILGFRHRPDLSKIFAVIQVNENLGLDLLAADHVDPRHLAFCMDQRTFDSIFARLKKPPSPMVITTGSLAI